jgi:ribosomal protein L12E/L44/L45/RPP1/RPP2
MPRVRSNSYSPSTPYDDTSDLFSALNARFEKEEANRKLAEKARLDAKKKVFHGILSGLGAGAALLSTGGLASIPAIAGGGLKVISGLKNLSEADKSPEEAPSTLSKVLNVASKGADLAGGVSSIASMIPGAAGVLGQLPGSVSALTGFGKPAVDVAEKAVQTVAPQIAPVAKAVIQKETNPIGNLVQHLATQVSPTGVQKVVEEVPEIASSAAAPSVLNKVLGGMKNAAQKVDLDTVSQVALPAIQGAGDAYFEHKARTSLGGPEPTKSLVYDMIGGGVGGAAGGVMKQVEKRKVRSNAQAILDKNYEKLLDTGDPKEAAIAVKGIQQQEAEAKKTAEQEKRENKQEDKEQERKAERENKALQRLAEQKRQDDLREKRHKEKLGILKKNADAKNAPKMSSVIPSITQAEYKERMAFAKSVGLHKNPDLLNAYLLNPDSLDKMQFTPKSRWPGSKDSWAFKNGVKYRKDPNTGDVIIVEEG